MTKKKQNPNSDRLLRLSLFFAPLSHPFRADNWKQSALGAKRKFTSPSTSNLNLDVLIVSPGGVGTSFFIRHLSKYVVTNCPSDSDGLKHAPRPTTISSHLKVIYLDGNTNEILASLERRGFEREQAGKLGSIAASLLPKTISRPLLRRAINQQRHVWLKTLPRKQLLHLHYDEIWKRLDDVEAYLNLQNTDFRSTFPAQRRRSSQSKLRPV